MLEDATAADARDGRVIPIVAVPPAAAAAPPTDVTGRPVARGRRVRDLVAQGTEPDPRFTFANERTFLAWIRTALALVAAGIGVDSFATELPAWGRRPLAGILVLLGGVLALSAYRRWYQAEVAIRRSTPLPPLRLAPIVAYGLAGGAALALVVVLVG